MNDPRKKLGLFTGLSEQSTVTCFYITEELLPRIIQDFNAGLYDDDVFTDKNQWKHMSQGVKMAEDVLFDKIKVHTYESDQFPETFHMIALPETSTLTAAKACLVVVDHKKHEAIQYILESSLFGSSMIILMQDGMRLNTGRSIPADKDELRNFLNTVARMQGNRAK